jgi:hypothetical protein
MDSNLNKQDVIRKYEKPETKKHDAINTVQGSMLYYNYNSGGSYYYTSLYYTSLYYRY